MTGPASRRSLLLSAVVLSTCIGLLGGAVGAWGIYARFGPVERVVTQPVNLGGAGGGLSIGAVAQQASASVVEIATHSVGTQSLIDGSARLVAGFVVSADGLVLTSIHAVRGATALTIATADGRNFPATIVRADAAHGIVLLRATGAQGLVPVAFGTDTPRPGDLSIVVAHAPFFPLILGTGVVSSTGRTLTLADGEPALNDVLSVDATPDPREDGAPLLSGSGTAIGVVVDAHGVAPGVVALSGRAAADLAQQASGGSGDASRPTLGLETALLDPATAALTQTPLGALVRSVIPGGPGARAGVAPGDIITAVDGVGIDAQHPLDAVALGLTPDQQVTLTVWRAGTTQSIPLTVGAAGPSAG